MKLGVQAPLIAGRDAGGLLTKVVHGAEELGFESFWLGDHPVNVARPRARYPYSSDGSVPPYRDLGLWEPLVSLSYLAGCTSTIRLGAGVIVLPQRNPVFVAKEAACVDVLSGGRLELGIGVGWDSDEYHAVGASWSGRDRRTDEYLEVIRLLWTRDVVSFEGQFTSFPLVSLLPKPIQPTGPPVHIGGNRRAALRRAARAGEGWLAFNLAPKELCTVLRMLDEELELVDRYRSTISVGVITGQVEPSETVLERFAGLGVDRVIVSLFGTETHACLSKLEAVRVAYENVVA